MGPRSARLLEIEHTFAIVVIVRRGVCRCPDL